MKILLTGASTFTGSHIAVALANGGHDVTVTFRHKKEDYESLKAKRLSKVERFCHTKYDCPFGSDEFINQIMEDNWDILCHHGAELKQEKDDNFDVASALERNTHRIKDVLNCLERKNCQHICITGSIMEPNEGAGSEAERAFSTKSLSKSFVSQLFKHYCRERGMRLGKFVVPNPFGALEEPKLCSYLAQNWLKHKIPVIRSPRFIRDHIPVDLLAKAYLNFIEDLSSNKQGGYQKLNPSCFPESIEAFTLRLAAEMEPRWGCRCDYAVKEDEKLEEPRVRINTDILNTQELEWNESKFWDELANYYQQQSFRSS